jgi:hypothetical protein
MYLKEIRLSFWASLFGAIAWMFNGYVMVWLEFEHVPMMALGLSSSLFAIERWFSKRTKVAFIGMIVGFGFCLSIGYAHLLIIQFIFFACYLCFRLIKNQLTFEESPIDTKMIINTIIACILSGIIGMHFLTSHMYLHDSGQRKGMDVHTLFDNTGILLSKYLVTVGFPDFYGSPTRNLCFTPRSKVNQSYNNYNELCIYSGMISLFLAFSSLMFIRQSSYISFYLISGLLCLTFSMGSPLYSPLVWWVPGLNLSTPTRVLYIYGFSICMLSAHGFEYLLRQKHKGIIFIWMFLVIGCIFLASFVQTHNGLRWATGLHDLNLLSQGVYNLVSRHYHWQSEIIGMPLIFAITSFFLLLLIYNTTNASIKTILCTLVLALLSFDLIGFGLLYNTTTSRSLEYPETPDINYLKNDPSLYRIMTLGPFLHHAFVPYGIEDISGYGSFYPKRYARYLFISQHKHIKNLPDQFSRWIQFKHPNSPLLDLLNVKYILTPIEKNLNSSQFTKVYNGKINIYENKSAFPRAFCVSSFDIQTTDNGLTDMLRQWNNHDFQHKVLLEKQPDLYWKLKSHENTFMKSTVHIQKYQPNTIILKVKAPHHCMLVLGDSYHPGWQAFVDDVPETIYRANYIMRAVVVPKGEHTVTFQFKPNMLRFGWFTTIIGWIIAGILMLYFSFQKRKKKFVFSHYA